MERTLVIIKPDALQRGLASMILSRFERRGLKIVALKMLKLDKKTAEKHYAIHQDKPFFGKLTEFITSSPVIVCVLEGKKAIEVVRQTMGKTDPAEASPGTIRGDFGIDIGHNLVHGSDSKENAEKEIKLFFLEEEIFNYPRDMDKWVT